MLKGWVDRAVAICMYTWTHLTEIRIRCILIDRRRWFSVGGMQTKIVTRIVQAVRVVTSLHPNYTGRIHQ